MKIIKRAQIAGFMSFFMTQTLSAETVKWRIDSTQSPVVFQAIGKPGFLKINGENARLEGEFISRDGRLSGVLNVPIAPITTGIELRDSHMKDNYFAVDKFPNAVLTLEETASTLDGGEQPFKGRLKLKNIEKPVGGLLILKNQNSKVASGHAEFEVKMSDYKELGVPSFKGVTVAETVKISVDLKADRL